MWDCDSHDTAYLSVCAYHANCYRVVGKVISFVCENRQIWRFRHQKVISKCYQKQ